MEDISNGNRFKPMELDMKTKPVNHDEEEDESLVMLPDVIVERIISILPYPHIFKAKELSKEWYSKLSNTKDADHVWFREMVKSNCSNWPVFFPGAFVNGSISLVGFDRLTGTWLQTFFNLPSLVTKKILNAEILTSTRIDSQEEQPAGKITGIDSLICSPVSFRETEIFVLNTFTGNWKWLPPRPNFLSQKSILASGINMFSDGSDDYYKVLTMRVLVTRASPYYVWKYQICTQLYESKSDSWTTKLSDVRTSRYWFGDCKGVYLNGSMYFIMRDTRNELSSFFGGVWAYNIKQERWHQFRISPLIFRLCLISLGVKLIVSKGRLMLGVRRRLSILDQDGFLSPSPKMSFPMIREKSFSLFEIDTLTKNYSDSEVYRGPPEPISNASTNSYISEGDSIFFSHDKGYTKYIMEFSISRQVWISHPNPSSSEDGSVSVLHSNFVLQPGKNPFVVV